MLKISYMSLEKKFLQAFKLEVYVLVSLATGSKEGLKTLKEPRRNDFWIKK